MRIRRSRDYMARLRFCSCVDVVTFENGDDDKILVRALHIVGLGQHVILSYLCTSDPSVSEALSC